MVHRLWQRLCQSEETVCMKWLKWLSNRGLYSYTMPMQDRNVRGKTSTNVAWKLRKNCKKIAWNYMKVAINCVISKNVGYQSPYLSYAKWALYHLSYNTSWLSQKTAHTCRPAFTRIYEVGITFRILFRGLLRICNLQNVQWSAKIWPCLD